MLNKRVLLVEDESIIAQILKHVLWTEGYRVDIASNLADGLKFLDTETYQLVITDWRLPDGDGLLIADIGADMGAKTVIMSGYLFQMPACAERHETVMKPLRPGEVVEFVERFIGKSSAIRHEHGGAGRQR